MELKLKDSNKIINDILKFIDTTGYESECNTAYEIAIDCVEDAPVIEAYTIEQVADMFVRVTDDNPCEFFPDLGMDIDKFCDMCGKRKSSECWEYALKGERLK